eukprot:TRINITY_DN2332_c0_g1_i2.p1 TRINITY_DN2332_c0_g1~~TRINITY_DN2332_c0_g1_i2.p1  ORF type:complete len:910 (+),score=196.99 TRINITY_DN2332_c0_g1_i2:48-2777(+)
MARFRLFPCLVLICVCAAVEKFPLRKLESLAGRIAKADVKSVRNDARRARILASAVLGGVHAKKTTNTASKKERRNAPSNKAAWKELASQKATSKKTEKKIAALKVGIRNTKATISKWRKGSFQKKASHRTASKKTAPKRGASKKARPKKTARRTRSTKRAASMKTAWHMATHGKVATKEGRSAATKEGEDIFLADSAAAKSRVTNSALTAKPILMQAERNVRTSWHRKVVKAQRAIGKTLQKAMTAIGKLAETESNKDRRKKGGPTKSKLIASMVSRERGDLKQVIASTARNIKKADSVFMHSTSEAFKRFDKAAAKTRKKVLKVTGNAASLEKKLEDGEKSAVAAMPARTKRVLRSLAQSEEADFENEMADEAHALQEQIKRKAKKSLRSMHKIFKKQGRYLRQLVETAKRRSKSAVTRARRRLTGKAKSHKSSKKARGASKTVKTQEKSHKSSKKARDASKTGKTQAKRRSKGAVTRAKKRVKDKAKRKSKSAVTRAKRRSRDKAGGRIGYNYMEGADKLMKKFDATIKKQFQEVKVQGDQITKDTLKMGKEKSHKSSKKARHASKTGMGKAQAASNGFMKGAVEQLKKSAANEEHMFEQTTEKSHKASERSRDASESRKNEEKSHKSSKRSRDASKSRKNEEKSHKSSKRSRDASKTRKNEEKSHKSSKRSRDASKTRKNEEKSHKSSKRSRDASKTRKNEEKSHKSSKRSRDASKTRTNEEKSHKSSKRSRHASKTRKNEEKSHKSSKRSRDASKTRKNEAKTARRLRSDRRRGQYPKARRAKLVTAEGFHMQARHKKLNQANKAELETSERKRSRRKAPKKANKAELKTSERKRSRRKAPKKARQSTRHTPDGFHLQEARQKHRKKARKKPRTTGWTYEDLGAVRTPARTYQLEQLPQPSLPR